MRHLSFRWLPHVAACLLLTISRAAPAIAQAVGTITGTVVAAGSESPVASAQIAAQGTNRLTVSDVNGRFRLTGLPAGEVVIEVRRVGFRPLTQRVTAGTDNVRFVLNETPLELNALVVTGQAGAVEKRAIGNSIPTIDAANIAQAASVNTLSNLINGRAPGVVVTGGTGRAGAGTVINIRGRSTLSLTQQPLIYIDGVRVSNDVGTGPRVQGGNVVSRLDDIDPEDIESIEIIKGPSAATLYGTEAANGVVQIITKKGGSGAPHFQASTRQGTQWFMDAADRWPTNYAKDASGNIVTWNAVKSEAARGTPLFNTGRLQTYELNLRGGERAINYYLSSSYDHDTGIEPNNRVGRFTGHANLSIAPRPEYDVSTSLHVIKGLSYLGNDYGSSRFFSGEFGSPLTVNGPTRGFFQAPPEALDAAYLNSQALNRFTGSVQLNHRPVHWFSQRLTLGLDQTNEDNQALSRYVPPQYVQFFGAVASQGGLNQDLRNISYATADYSGTATIDLPKSLVSTSSIGGQLYRKRIDSTAITALQFPAPNLTTAAAAANVKGSQNYVTNTTLGMFVQQQLGWRDRMFLTGAVRVDNNSAFGKDVKLVTYPKVSGSWVVSDEGFWRFAVIDQLRLRAAYGLSGQQPDAFAALQTYVPSTGPLDQPIVTPQFPGNSNLKPERSQEFETGFEASFFKRVSLDFTYYNKSTHDAILSRGTAPSGGFPNPQFVNIGRIDNHGMELALTANAANRRDFSWDIGASVATNHDRIADMGGLPPIVFSGLPFQHQEEGFPISAYYSKKVVSATYDPTTKKAINALCDGGIGHAQGGAPVPCATAPQVFIGTSTPKQTGAVNTTFTLWRWLKLYGMADFRKGNKLLNATDLIRCSIFLVCDVNVNPQNYDPRYLVTVQNGSGLIYNDEFSQDASFWRLREISATITVPERYAARLNASAASITFAGRNLHTWTRYPGLDPEARSQLGIQNDAFDQAVSPSLAQFVTTFTLTF
ncbi:MAG TPA: SusC/RagA family TonB-linked outer membrane protein [Gemmatimonadaceae bacterium]|nr:SusC/RagA family TonB-linked outer membrane protein [Gemmatimonadaceae bacterium]